MPSSFQFLSQLGLSSSKSQKSLLVSPDLIQPQESSSRDGSPSSDSRGARKPRRVTAAQARSDEIDRRLRKEADLSARVSPPVLQQQPSQQKLRQERERHVQQPDLSILLLGQQGAGKTTVLKQMRLLYDPQTHERERHGWRLVIFLNIITAARIMLERIEEYEESKSDCGPSVASTNSCDYSTPQTLQPSDSQLQFQQQLLPGATADDLAFSFGHRNLIMQALNSAPGANRSRLALTSRSEISLASHRPFPSTVLSTAQPSRSAATRAKILRLRLAPLLTLERELREELGAIGDDVDLSGNAVVSGTAAWAQRIPAPSNRSLSSLDDTGGPREDSILVLKPGWLRKFGGGPTDSQATLTNNSDEEGKGNEGVDSPYTLMPPPPPPVYPLPQGQLQSQAPIRTADLSVPSEKWHHARARSGSNASDMMAVNNRRQERSVIPLGTFPRHQLTNAKSIPSLLSKAMSFSNNKGPVNSAGNSGGFRRDSMGMGRGSTDTSITAVESAEEVDGSLSNGNGKFKRVWQRQRTQSSMFTSRNVDRTMGQLSSPPLPASNSFPVSQRASSQSGMSVEEEQDGQLGRMRKSRPAHLRRSISSIDEMVVPMMSLVPQTAPLTGRRSIDVRSCHRDNLTDGSQFSLVGSDISGNARLNRGSSSTDSPSCLEGSEQEMLRDTNDFGTNSKTSGPNPRRNNWERGSSGSSNGSANGHATPRSASAISHNNSQQLSPPSSSMVTTTSLPHFSKFSPATTWDSHSSCATSVHSVALPAAVDPFHSTSGGPTGGNSMDSFTSNLPSMAKLEHERTESSSQGSDWIPSDGSIARFSVDGRTAHTSTNSTLSTTAAFHGADSAPIPQLATFPSPQNENTIILEPRPAAARRKTTELGSGVGLGFAGKNLKKTANASIDDPAVLLAACKDEILSLWRDPVVVTHRRMGSYHGESDVHYLIKNLDRIAAMNFKPTDEDIMHARVRTQGVIEERFRIHPTLFCRIFDVGGSTYQRKAWSPFFDNQVDSFIFLAPLSAYDQTLNEDPTMNRLQDSLGLFKSIMDSPLLRRASVILFLNKIDILKRKLRRAAVSAGRAGSRAHGDGSWEEEGDEDDDYQSFSSSSTPSPEPYECDSNLDVRTHFPDYTGHPHDFESVWRFFRDAFLGIASSAHYPASLSTVTPSRAVYVHPTVAVDRIQIGGILRNVMDGVLDSHLTEITVL
ncbi:hypothetical protein CF326_g5621 [Tilletia indica]|nr:hypothetical protein CF326_g5621 [Tilletia indica]